MHRRVWLLVRITCAAPLGTAPLTTFGGFGHRSGIVLSHAGAQLVWDYFKENLDQIKDMLKAASPSLMGAVVVNAISAFSTLERAQEIKDFFKVWGSGTFFSFFFWGLVHLAVSLSSWRPVLGHLHLHLHLVLPLPHALPPIPMDIRW